MGNSRLTQKRGLGPLPGPDRRVLGRTVTDPLLESCTAGSGMCTKMPDPI